MNWNRNQQLEFRLGRIRAMGSVSRRQAQLSQVRWWFSQMRLAVDQPAAAVEGLRGGRRIGTLAQSHR